MDWAFAYADLQPYYDRVEALSASWSHGRVAAISDGVFLPAMPLNCAETIFTAACKNLGWPSTHRRLAQLTQPHNGRPACHYCGNCVNGCDVGAMFNPVAVTLPPALTTGRLDILTDSVVARVRMNRENRAQGVTYIERLHDEGDRRRRQVGDSGGLDAGEHETAPAVGYGGLAIPAARSAST